MDGEILNPPDEAAGAVYEIGIVLNKLLLIAFFGPDLGSFKVDRVSPHPPRPEGSRQARSSG